MQREVPFAFWNLLQPFSPLDATRQRIDRRGVSLVHGVVHHRETGAGGRERALGACTLSVVEHGAEGEHGAPVELLVAAADRHHAVAELARDRESLRSVRGDDDRRSDRARGRELRPVQHLHDRALDLDLLTPQQAAQLLDVPARPRPGERLLAHRHAAGEAGTDRDGDASRREVLERRDRARLRERVPEVGNEHRRSERDARGSLRGERRNHPDVAVERG